MTWILLMVLGLATTGLVYPNYEWITETVNTNKQIIQMYEDELQRNFMAEQEKIIVEDYFLFLEKIGKIKYARGCMGEYSPASRSEEKQKRVKCSDNAFDCAGLVKWYGIAKGIISSQEASHYNSQSLMTLATQKDGRTAKRWDRTSRQGYWDRSTGNLSTHFAMVSRDYSWGNTLRVYDNVNWTNNNVLGERAIKVAYIGGKFHYMGRYKITVYTNGFVELAQSKGLIIEPRIDTDETEVPMSQVDPENPMGFSATVNWFDYDSMANRIASYRIDNWGTQYMVAKFKAEAHFNSKAIGKDWEQGICQLLPNKTNNVWLNDPRWSDPMFQAQVCLDKRKAVPNPDKIWHANAYTEMDNIILHK